MFWYLFTHSAVVLSIAMTQSAMHGLFRTSDPETEILLVATVQDTSLNLSLQPVWDRLYREEGLSMETCPVTLILRGSEDINSVETILSSALGYSMFNTRVVFWTVSCPK